MPSHKLLLLLVIPAILIACNRAPVSSSSSSEATSSSSSSSTSEKKEVTLSGTSGQAEVAGDRVEIKEGTVFVNGASFGPVPAGAEVKYIVSTEGRALLVAGERRNAVK